MSSRSCASRLTSETFRIAHASPSSNPEQPGPQLSPPFVLSVAVSPAGILAASTANGLVFVGAGGEKRPTGQAQKKRKRKWDGLNEGEGTVMKVAEGPVVAVCVFVLPPPICYGAKSVAVHFLTNTDS